MSLKIVPTNAKPTRLERKLARQMTRDLQKFIGSTVDETTLALATTEIAGLKLSDDGTIRAMTREEIDAALPATESQRSIIDELGFVLDEK